MEFKNIITDMLTECRNRFPDIDDKTFLKFAFALAKEMYGNDDDDDSYISKNSKRNSSSSSGKSSNR